MSEPKDSDFLKLDDCRWIYLPPPKRIESNTDEELTEQHDAATRGSCGAGREGGGNVSLFEEESGAEIEGAYRYQLWRQWDAGPTMAFVMLNPSTADAGRDDATIRRLYTFARQAGCGGFRVVNLFAYRATDPNALRVCENPVGPQNDACIESVCAVADAIVCAWGAWPAYQGRIAQVERLIRAAAQGKPICCLGRTKGGYPRHPLYVKSSQGLERY